MKLLNDSRLIALLLVSLFAIEAPAVPKLRQSTPQQQIHLGPFVDASDGVTPETGIALVIETNCYLSKDGAISVLRGDTTDPVHDRKGWYTVQLNATDTNTLGELIIEVSDETTHLPVWAKYEVVPANVYDSTYGANKLQVDVTHIQGGILQGGTNPGVVATNFNTFFNNVDAGSSVKVDDIEAILVDTGTAGVVVNSASAQTIVDLWFDELVADHDDVAGSWGALLADVFTETLWDAFITGAPEYVEPPTSGENATAVWTEPVRTLTGTE